MSLDYDHRFKEICQGKIRLTWIVEGEGTDGPIVGRVFAWMYNRNLDKAIPALQTVITAQ